MLPKSLQISGEEVELMAGMGQPAALHTAHRTKALALKFIFRIKHLQHGNQA